MKTYNRFYILLSIIALVLATLACGSTTTTTSQSAPAPTKWVRPTAHPTARPTEAPIESSCVTPDLLEYFITDYFGITPYFAYDPEISTWDKSFTKNWTNETVIISYSESGGCLTGIGVVTLTAWGAGDFGKTGSYLGILGLIAQDQNALPWVQNNIQLCASGDRDETRNGSDGSYQMFACQDLGTSMLIGAAYHLNH